MANKKESDECASEDNPSQADSYDGNKSGTFETYDMKDFCPGIRIEAKDFDGKWYPAKVSDVDWSENEILVHFENRTTKVNEWIPMDSSRLRPIQKSIIQQNEVAQFSKGEEVMAVWSANQRYPAVIQAVLANDRYDVLFSDGFLKRLKSHKITKLPGDSVRGDIKNFTDIGTKEERRERKRKINVAELFHINKRPKKKGLVHSKSQDIKTYPVSKSQSKSTVLKKTVTSEETKMPETDPKTLAKTPAPALLTTNKNLVDVIPAAFEVKYLNGQTETWSKQLYQRSEGRTAGKLDIVILNPQGRKFRSRNEIMKYCEENGIVYSHEAFDFSAKGRPKSKSILQTQPVKPETSLEDKLSQKKCNKRSLEAISGTQGMAIVPGYQNELLPPENVTPNKVFIGDYEVVIENGKFICPVKVCGKHFRRENLLHMHMKHYHPEFSKYLDYTPSVTDLAYARTVGNLDTVEISPAAPRKVASIEKPEKSLAKIESRKTNENSAELLKEAKKSKTSESKVEGRSHSVKAPTNTPNTSAVLDEPIDEKILSVGIPAGRRTPNEAESSVQGGENLPENIIEDTGTLPEHAAQPQNLLKSSKHHRLHNRKKKSGFQGSFTEHLKKKRFISQDRSKSQIKLGRQQQSQHLRHQLQQLPTPQIPISSLSTAEETNSNTLSQSYTMARYPKPHLNISNEISGKNNLLTSYNSTSPVSEKCDESESVGNESAVQGSLEEVENFEESEKIRESEDSRRNFLTGLLKARKRTRKRLRKKRARHSSQDSFNSGQFEKPDESGKDAQVFDAPEYINPNERSENDLEEKENVENQMLKKIVKLNTKRSNDICTYESSNEDSHVESPGSNEPDMLKSIEPNSEDGDVSKLEVVEKTNEVMENKIENPEITGKGLTKSFVLLENICRRDSHIKNLNVTIKNNDENSYLGHVEKKERGGRKRPRKFSRKDRKLARKRVRFENTVTEKWISVDEEDLTSCETRMKTRKEDKKKKKKLDLEIDANQKRTDHVTDEKCPNNKISNLDQAEGTEDSKSPLVLENDKVEKLRRNEIINCLCGITEEDGLMIQCDLCLCWQHGHCAGILSELDVPDKYTCAICKNPYRARSSMKYMHDQEWLKEGTLPSLSFRSKREEIINQRRTILKRSHDLSGSITLLAQVIHSLRIKVNIAEKKDHPKLWLWAKKWTEKKPNRLKEEPEIKEERPEEQNVNSSSEIKIEGETNLDEKQLPKAPEPEAPIDSAECRINLLDHLIHYQTLVDDRLSCIESLVAELESMQDDVVSDEAPDRYPRTKATVQMILRDLNTMKKIAII